ncbi:hypothetical protein Tco_0781544 [Tanacetum coccineum]
MAYNSSSSSSSNFEVTTCTKTYLKNYETLKKQYDDLIVKLNDTEFKASTYKRGLAIVEAQLVTFRKNEVLFSEEIIVLKREVGCKNYEIGVLKTEFEKVKQEKEGIDFKIAKFDNASKDLDKMLESQITDKSKKGIGYHVVALPHPLSLNAPTKLDLSYSGLKEFQQPEFEGYRLRANKSVSNNEDEVESPIVVEKKTVVPTIPKVEVIQVYNGLGSQEGLILLFAGQPRDKIGKFNQFDDEKRAGAELTEENDNYALTKKPKVFISFIKQFWNITEASTNTDGEVTIIATIDGQSKTITEASLRRHLKLEDHDVITSIPNSEIFEQLALMGYPADSDKLTFQKGIFSPQWRFLIHTILYCLSPKKTVWEQFSSNIATALICLATNRKYNFSRLIFEHMKSKEARKDKGKAIMTEPEPEKKSKKLLEQERLGLEEAIRLQKQVDEEEKAQIARDEEIARQLLALDEERVTTETKTTKDIDWNDPSVQRYYWDMKNKPKSEAQARKNMIVYLKNQSNYKMKDFDGMSYDEIRNRNF